MYLSHFAGLQNMERKNAYFLQSEKSHFLSHARMIHTIMLDFMIDAVSYAPLSFRPGEEEEETFACMHRILDEQRSFSSYRYC